VLQRNGAHSKLQLYFQNMTTIAIQSMFNTGGINRLQHILKKEISYAQMGMPLSNSIINFISNNYHHKMLNLVVSIWMKSNCYRLAMGGYLKVHRPKEKTYCQHMLAKGQ
jgi:hypothetical protein